MKLIPPYSFKMLASKTILTQTRKFGCKFVFSSQEIDKLGNLASTLEEAGATYMLLKRTKEDGFNKFKNKWESFEFEDLKEMEKFSSLNLVYYSKGYSSFITKLPKPINKRTIRSFCCLIKFSIIHPYVIIL